MELKFTSVIQERLKGQNLSAIARKLDMPKALLHDWVQSKRLPSFRNLNHVLKLAGFLGLTLEELLIGSSNRKIISSVEFEDSGQVYQICITKMK